MYNEATLKEEFTSSVRLAVVRELKEKFKNELMREISNPISEKLEDIARESMSELIENASKKKYKFRIDYMEMVSCVGGKDKVIISPILAWTDKDVWEFLNKMGIEHCDLYDKGRRG